MAQKPEAPGVPPPCAGLTLSALSCRDEAVRGAGGKCFVGANPEGENLRGGRESVPQKANSANRVDGDSEDAGDESVARHMVLLVTDSEGGRAQGCCTAWGTHPRKPRSLETTNLISARSVVLSSPVPCSGPRPAR